VHDGIEIERRGKPAAVILTDRFTVTGRAMAAVAGLTEYPFATAPHPLSTLTDEEISQRAAALVPSVIQLLTERSPQNPSRRRAL
jgi:hypothetical protein